jgi:ABC-2 type transport system permease protein
VSDLFLFRNAFRDLLRPKRLTAAICAAVFPAFVALVLRAAAPAGRFQPEAAFNSLQSLLVYGFALVILAVIFGTGVIAQEIEQHTITYLLTRPLPRWRIALVKLQAAVLGITVALWVATLLLALVVFGPVGLSLAHVGRDLAVLPLGALAYGSVFLLVATLLNRPLLWGLGYAFGLESWVANMPGDFQRLSIATYLRVLAPHPQPEGESMELTRLLSLGNVQSISPTFAGRVLVVVIVVALTLALVIFSTREYVPREDTD